MKEIEIEFIREAYVFSDYRFRDVAILAEHFELPKVLALLTELGGFRIKKSEVTYSGFLSLGPVLRRTIGNDFMLIFEVLKTTVFTLPTIDAYTVRVTDVESYSKIKKREWDKKSATKNVVDAYNRVRKFIKDSGLEFN